MVDGKGETVVLEQVVTGAHTGAFVTPFGTLEPRGNLIRSWRSYFDQLEMLTRLGVIPLP